MRPIPRDFPLPEPAKVQASVAAALSPAARDHFSMQAQIETAAMRLAAVLGPRASVDGIGHSFKNLFEGAWEEVEHREALFAEIRRGSIRKGPHPKLAALESVTQDVIHGRLT